MFIIDSTYFNTQDSIYEHRDSNENYFARNRSIITHSHIPILEASRLSQYNADDQQIIAHNNMLVRQPCHHMLDDEECVLFLAPKNILGFWLVKDYTMVIIHLGNEITLLDLRTNLEISAQGLDRFNSYLNDLSSKEVDVYFDKITQQLVIATMDKEEEPPPSITSLQLHPPRIHCCFSLQILEKNAFQDLSVRKYANKSNTSVGNYLNISIPSCIMDNKPYSREP
ncbi:hypothetical protein C9374_001903 [Naegleria lovaniensis]|uniref:Uncharacterized protein n=1 Tax=Naegleria lovaniensis TaxID=51637 RepID=A0AA88GV34_NAELO|nr:uncharacterized protein C9374_001903 [Naegleria lovaniensis]KAG2386868.1 hypothetical protein C9374_001903 [Naegleria lovaniensis]